MSIPKKQLHDLVDLIAEEDRAEVVAYLEQYLHYKTKEPFDPKRYFGILKDWDIDVEKECTRMREEWDHRGWDAISD